jgi:hypothetical protein
MIIDQNFVFIHIPKTGGTWMRHALRRLPTFIHEYAGHVLDVPAEHLHKPTMLVVRNPWDLYVSTYTHFHHNFTKKINEFDPRLKNTPQAAFMEQRFGGSFENMMRHLEPREFMSKSFPFDRMPVVLKYEKGLANELFTYLNYLEVPIPGPTQDKIRELQNSRFNAHQQYRTGTYYTKELEELVAENDSFLIDIWDYRCPDELKTAQD